MRFFEESFLLADIKPNVVLEIPFLIINNEDIISKLIICNKVLILLKKCFQLLEYNIINLIII